MCFLKKFFSLLKSVLFFLHGAGFPQNVGDSCICSFLYLLILSFLLNKFSVCYYSLPSITRGKRYATEMSVGFSVPLDQEQAVV